MEKLTLEKYHGLGNDYFVLDNSKTATQLTGEMVKKICDRHYGLGSDGILEGPTWGKKVWKKDCSGIDGAVKNDEKGVMEERFGVTIWNPDGSQAEKSGNGLRIFAKYLKDAGYVTGNECVIETAGGEVKVFYLDEEGNEIKVDMGTLAYDKKSVGAVDVKGDLEEELVEVAMTFGKKNYLCTCVSVGNPHCVIPMKEISKELVCAIGEDVEKSSYFPKRINTQIVKVVDRNHVDMEIYERGAGYTLASGSSCCAVAGALYHNGQVDENVQVHMPGGTLSVQITENERVYLTGPVAYVGTVIPGKSLME